MDYELQKLTSRSFEQLIQALALKIFGAATVIFGDGPDGGREAVARGRYRYRDVWDGSVCFQAKFLQVPRNTRDDQRWLFNAMKDELRRYRRRRMNPRLGFEYYIVVTNVNLTAVLDSGGRDLIDDLLADPENGFDDFDVWDYRKICALLDGDADVRKAYAAWVTPGDVLSAMADMLETLLPRELDFKSVLRR